MTGFKVTIDDVTKTDLLDTERQVMFANCYGNDMQYAVSVISILLGMPTNDKTQALLQQWCQTFDELADHWSALVIGRL